MTSVDLMRAAAVSPFFSCNSPHCGGRDYRRNVYVVDRQNNFCQQTFHAHAHHFADQLIASTDAPVPFPRLWSGFRLVLSKERLQGSFRDAVMAPRGAYCLQFSGQNPLLDGGIADPQQAGCLTRGKNRGRICHEYLSSTSRRWLRDKQANSLGALAE